MGLDDICADFLDMCFSDISKDRDASSWRERVEWLHETISSHDFDYAPGTRRVVIALCDRVLRCDDATSDKVGSIRLIRLAETVSVSGCHPPGSPQADEADRWLKIVIADCDPAAMTSGDEVSQ